MKKILFGFLIVLLILAGIIFYQRQKITGSLRDILKGKTYGSYGIKVEIPPSSGGVKGIFKPYVNLPRVVLNLSAWGLKVPLNLEKAVVFQELWGDGSLVLEIPRDLTPKEDIAVERLSMELGLDDSIKILSAKGIRIKKKGKNPDQLYVSAPQLKMGPLNSVIPDLLMFSVSGIEYAEGKKGPSNEDRAKGFQMGPFQIGVESNLEGDRRRWNVFSFGEGGDLESPKGNGELGGWKFTLQGTAKNLSLEELKKIIQELKSIEPELKGADIKKSGPTSPIYRGSNQVYNFLSRLQIVPVSNELHWEGLKVAGAEGTEKVLIAPLLIDAKFEDRSGQFEAQASGSLDQISVRPKGERPPVILTGLNFSYDADYIDTSFSELLGYIFRYYQLTYLNVKGHESPDFVREMVLTSIAQYPDVTNFAFKIGKLSFETENLKSQHRDMSFEFFLKPRQLGYTAKDSFDYEFNKEKPEDIQNGQGQLSLIFILPWDGIVQSARRILREGKIPDDILENFIEREVGAKLDLLLDLGPNYFIVELNSALGMALKDTLRDFKFPQNWQDKRALDKWGEKLGKTLVQEFAEKGTFTFDLKVDRLSKLQAALEKEKSGSSLGLVFLAPYSQIDSAQDTLLFRLAFKKGKLLVNDQPNPALQKLIDPFFKKMGVNLP